MRNTINNKQHISKPQRIMWRYNDSKTGSLSREEFMQLASMVEREYAPFRGRDTRNTHLFAPAIRNTHTLTVKTALFHAWDN